MKEYLPFKSKDHFLHSILYVVARNYVKFWINLRYKWTLCICTSHQGHNFFLCQVGRLSVTSALENKYKTKSTLWLPPIYEIQCKYSNNY